MAERSPFSEALHYHEFPIPGKVAIRATKPTATQTDLSLAYTPGVAEPCREIARDAEAAFRFTNRGNLVAVVSNGTAVVSSATRPLAGKRDGREGSFKRLREIDFSPGDRRPRSDEVIRFCELLNQRWGNQQEDIRLRTAFTSSRTRSGYDSVFTRPTRNAIIAARHFGSL